MVSTFSNLMSHWRCIPVTVRHGIVLMLVAVLFCGQARTAQATCGDWLDNAIHESASDEFASLDSMLESPGRPCDCRGPMCDNENPGNNPLPAPDVELNPQRDFATLRERLACQSPNVSWNTRWGTAAEQEGFPVTIERPPRAM